MTATKQRNFEELASLAGWDLAKRIGCEFSGDCFRRRILPTRGR